jgi:hypothetical protein
MTLKYSQLALSNNHISPETMKLLEHSVRYETTGLEIEENDYSWLIRVDTSVQVINRITENLESLLKYAEKLGHNYLLIDLDGPDCDDLIKY